MIVNENKTFNAIEKKNMGVAHITALRTERKRLHNRVKEVILSSDTLKPKVSVIVPIYNAEYTLEQALKSIEDQSLEDLEIICVNDASVDNSSKIIEKHAAEDKRYVVVNHGINSGYGASMNDGISVARGEWIAILEPDDYIYPQMYKTLITMANTYDEDVIDIVKSPYIREIRAEGVKRGDKPITQYNCSYRHRIKPAQQPFTMADASAAHLLRHHPSIWSAIYRYDFIVGKEIFFVEYPGAGWADNEFFYETLLQAENILYTDIPYYVYREETDEEYNSFAIKNKTLPFDRWNSMADIIERLGIENEHIKRSHVAKGFTYLNGQLKALGNNDKIINDEANKMFARMEKDIVLAEDKINPGLKAKYYEAENLDIKSGKSVYIKSLINEFNYTVKNNGILYAMRQVMKVLVH